MPDQKVLEGIPAEFVAVFEALDDTLLFQFRQFTLLHQLHGLVQLGQGLAEVVEALLPADVGVVHVGSLRW
ncbi:hypothetical protein D3C71_2129760 [compost metagenome]